MMSEIISGVNYVSRGYVPQADFDLDDLTPGSSVPLDLSGIVPSSAQYVHFKFDGTPIGDNRPFGLLNTPITVNYCISRAVFLSSGINQIEQGIISLLTPSTITYAFTAGHFSKMELTVLGWFV